MSAKNHELTKSGIEVMSVLKIYIFFVKQSHERDEMFDSLQYYPDIEICQTEKDGDIAEKEREYETALEEDFGASFLGVLRYTRL